MLKRKGVSLPEIRIVGISGRTNNKAEFSGNGGIIANLLQKYHSLQLADKIKGRTKPGVTYCVYTGYDSDEHGDYTYFIGEEVEEINLPDNQYDSLIIAPQEYCQFEVGPGQMPDICIASWKKIWQMNKDDFGSDRSYVADFERYDSRAKDPTKAKFDIYIGTK